MDAHVVQSIPPRLDNMTKRQVVLSRPTISFTHKGPTEHTTHPRSTDGIVWRWRYEALLDTVASGGTPQC